MSLTFAQIVGAINTWPALGSMALLNVQRQLCAARAAALPALGRPRVYYIAQGGSAPASITGRGTELSPWLCYDTADVAFLMAENAAVDVGFALAPGARWQGSLANADQSIYQANARNSIGMFGFGSAPELSTFVDLLALRTSAVGGLAQYSMGSLVCYWVRGRVPGPAGKWTDYRVTPYTMANNASEVAANPFTFCQTGTTLYVNYGLGAGAHDPDTLQGTFNTGNCLTQNNVDDLVVDDVALTGGGMNTPGTAGGACVYSFATDTNLAVRRRVTALWSGYHSVLANAGSSGGLHYEQDCVSGFHQWDANGIGDAGVCFATSGGNEIVRVRHRLYGGLAKLGTTIAPQTPYAHASGTNTAALVMNIDCDWTVPVGVRPIVYTLSDMSQVPPATGLFTAEFRTFMHGVRSSVNGLMATSGLCYAAFTACDLKVRIRRNTSAFDRFIGVGQHRMTFISSMVTGELVADLADPGGVVHSSKQLRVFDLSPNTVRWVHSLLRITGERSGEISFCWGNGLQTGSANQGAALYNSVVVVDCGTPTSAVYLTDVGNQFREADPLASVDGGGFSGCAFFGIAPAQYNTTASPVTLASVPANWTKMTVPKQLAASARAMPASITSEFDLAGRARASTMTKRTIGPFEYIPATGLVGRTPRVSRATRVSR